MIISENRKPEICQFRQLLKKTDELLNRESAGRETYYSKRNGTDLEFDVYDALSRMAKGTPFDETIQLVSGASFPDIVANKYFGVEVKSTNKNQWKSIGSSILESTRISDVERIFLTFGKLGSPIEFRSRPYEECLSGISVTHYPRYQIDMELKKGETIFDKMGISYDELRCLDNPVVPVSKYYKSLLRPGESLWWAGENIEEDAVPATVRLWCTLTPSQKSYYTVQGYALFPEILVQGSTSKYQRYALWLATKCGIINTNIRDQFSAGGKVDVVTINGRFENVPAAYGRIEKNRNLIEETILSTSATSLLEYWNVEEIAEDRIMQWCRCVAAKAENDNMSFEQIYKMLTGIFSISSN